VWGKLGMNRMKEENVEVKLVQRISLTTIELNSKTFYFTKAVNESTNKFLNEKFKENERILKNNIKEVIFKDFSLRSLFENE